jgi:hypothetical protein
MNDGDACCLGSYVPFFTRLGDQIVLAIFCDALLAADFFVPRFEDLEGGERGFIQRHRRDAEFVLVAIVAGRCVNFILFQPHVLELDSAQLTRTEAGVVSDHQAAMRNFPILVRGRDARTSSSFSGVITRGGFHFGIGSCL